MSDTKLKEEFEELALNIYSAGHSRREAGCQPELDKLWNWIQDHFISSKSTSTDYVNKNKEEWLKVTINDGV